MIPREWRAFGIGFGVLVAAVFVWEIVGLIGSVTRAEAGMETGAVLSVLFMIAATLGVVVVIGGGLWRAHRRAGRAEPPAGRAEPPGGQAEPPGGQADPLGESEPTDR